MRDLKKWKIFQNLDSAFEANIKLAYIIVSADSLHATGAGKGVLKIFSILFNAGLNECKLLS